ncbi:ABC transporter substrate-binding protein [Sphaerisporangium sp. NPDC051011]|uniref:ABC transporter substrate-binding protein n=1 Tax=Sphaerisporangium sp. NPDC051011 TaxID=3155792 RepID=UPI00340E9D9C
MIRAKTTLPLIAAGLLAAATLSACGSDNTDAPKAGGASESAPADAKSADPSLDPVVIGFRGLEGGTLSLTDMRKGFESAVDYVNSERGGINGHPLKVVTCKTDVTPESSVNCANKFVGERVVMATQGVDYATDAALPILQKAGIVDTSGFAYGPLENTAVGDAYVAYASNEEGYAAGVVQLAKMGAKSMAMVLADVPPLHTAMDKVIVPAAERLGVKVTPFFFSSPTDWTSFGATVLASDPNAIAFYGVDADCIAAVPAFRSLGFSGIIQAGTCAVMADKFKPSELTDVIVGNSIYNASMAPIPDDVQADIHIFERYTKDDGIENRGQAMQGFLTGTWVADLLSQVKGDLTAASVKSAMKTAKGRLFFRTTGYDCSKPSWPGTTACSTGFFFTKVNDAGKSEVLPGQPVDVSGILPSS